MISQEPHLAEISRHDEGCLNRGAEWDQLGLEWNQDLRWAASNQDGWRRHQKQGQDQR
jgi:hypothetical protein